MDPNDDEELGEVMLRSIALLAASIAWSNMDKRRDVVRRDGRDERSHNILKTADGFLAWLAPTVFPGT